MLKWIIAASLIPFVVTAKPVITTDHEAIYVRVAIPDMTDSKKRRAAELSVKLLQQKVAEMLRSNELPFDIHLDNMDTVRTASETITHFVQEVDVFNDNLQTSGFEWSDIIPTAIMAGVGTKVSVSLGLSVGGSFTLGLVVMPTYTYVIPRTVNNSSMNEQELQELVAQATDGFWFFDWDIIAWPNADIGTGVGFTPGVPRFSAGLIWGEMSDASDFSGVAFGLSSDVALGVEGGVKFGFLYNPSLGGLLPQMRYVVGSVGGGVGAGLRVNAVSGVISGIRALRLLGMSDALLQSTVEATDLIDRDDPADRPNEH